jgi:CBS-domain-containing membrane protein
VGGHVLSAIIGVTMYQLVPDMVTAAALAVGISIAVMYYARCIHPPGGATALVAVVGGDEIYQLGYQFVVTPVLADAVIILLVAMLVNFPFSWRRYPAALSTGPVFNKEEKCKYKDSALLPRKDIEYALKSMQTFADITEDELAIIFQKASQHQRDSHLKPADIQLGHYYMHGQASAQGSVRRVIDEADDSKNNLIIYKVITGTDRGKTMTSSRDAFAQWARFEVIFENEQWKIID